MAKLPLTVTEVVARSGELWAVRVAFFDGTTGQYLIPLTLATVEAVTISALAFGQLMDISTSTWAARDSKHLRYAPRV